MSHLTMASKARPVFNSGRCLFLLSVSARLIHCNSKRSRSRAYCNNEGPEPTTDLGQHPNRYYHHILRPAVRHQTDAFRDQHLQQGGLHFCPVSGQLLAEYNTQVDHCGPAFKDLVQGWLHELGHSSLSALRGIEAEDAAPRLPRKLERSWQRYHLQHAKLRLLSADGHRQMNMQHQQQP